VVYLVHRIDVGTPSLTKIVPTQNADPGTLEQSVEGPLLMIGSIGTVRLTQLARYDCPDWHGMIGPISTVRLDQLTRYDWPN